MSRIPYPDLDTMPASRLEKISYPRVNPLNITKVALHLPDGLWEAHFGLKDALVKHTTLADNLREVAILRIGFMADSAYILNHHISITANMGFSAAKQEAIKQGDYSDLPDDERAVAEFTDEMVRTAAASDETVAKMREMFGDALVMEMIVLVYSYWGTAMMIGVTGVELDEQAIETFDWTAEDAG